MRTTLQASEQAVNKFRGTLMKELLERSVRLWNNGNIWSDVGQVEVFALFIK